LFLRFFIAYLCKIFKAYTGKTPSQYINSVRIENACTEMKQTDKSITQIALENGFNDISYFCKVFKKHKGISAKKYT
jgi:AraC-like DNA-binding protein